MQVKKINSYRDIVAICDSNLIGKRFEEEEKQLNIKESFYKGEEKTKEEVLKIIKEMNLENATFNIVGEESINTALESGIINKETIKKIDEIPFAMVLV